MAGLLALAGGVEFNPGNEEQDRELLSAAGGGPFYVVPTAAARQHPEVAVATAQRWFRTLGASVAELPVLTRTQANSERLAEQAAGGRFFYLVGGDPGHVATTLRNSRVWSAIKDAWRRGASLAGSSAGAMALGEWTLIRARWPNHTERAFRDALDLVHNVAVLPHFEKFGHRWIDSARAAAPRPDLVLVGVDERGAALWDGRGWWARGPGVVTVVTSGAHHRFDSGQEIHGLPPPSTTSAG
jgi:cyanophycinase